MLLYNTLSTAIHEENTRNSILTGFTIKLIYNNILTTYYICNSMHAQFAHVPKALCAKCVIFIETSSSYPGQVSARRFLPSYVP